MLKFFLFLGFTAACLRGADPVPRFTITPEIRVALGAVSPDSLRGNLSFLASDLLEGRDTPSRGLDVAAEYIAAQFRRAGLEPAGNDGYFQTAKMMLQQPSLDGFKLSAEGAGSISIPAENAEIHTTHALDLAPTPIFKLDVNEQQLVEALTHEQLDGKVVMAELLSGGGMTARRKAMSTLRSAKPALVVLIERKAPDEPMREPAMLFDPEDHETRENARINLSGKAALAFYDALKPGLSPNATLTVHVASPSEKPVELRNVMAILRGSDASLQNTCVLVSAHYDHIGMKPGGAGDRIFNGANDDGSGTASVIELANALSKLTPRPKRSIVFVTFFGEEKGGFGSRYYARHPVIALKDTIADINLEQVGRTDSTEGPQIASASLTGFDYSDVADTLRTAGALTGVKIYKHAQNSDLYFGFSDNISLATAGVPAHSLTVAFNYSDYHGLGDEWQKIDYANMAKINRMVAAGVIMLADSAAIPRWKAENPAAAKYFEAWKQSHSGH